MTELDPHSAACVEVMRDAFLQARTWARSGDVPVQQLEDLMQAMHGIPNFVQTPDGVGIEEVRRALETYDRKWPNSVDDEHGLADLYDIVVAKQRAAFAPDNP